MTKSVSQGTCILINERVCSDCFLLFDGALLLQ